MSHAEHSLRVDRKAVVTAQYCSFGKHRLSTGIAYVLVDEATGDEYVAGNDCAHRYGRPGDFPPPDLTKVPLIVEPRDETQPAHSGGGRKGKTHAGLTAADQRRQAAERYLLLYGVELPRQGFSLAPADPIKTALEARQRNALSDEHLRPVWRMMQSMERPANEPAPECLDILQASSVATGLLDRCLNSSRLRGNHFLTDLRHTVVDQHWLSPKQVDRLNTNVAKIDPNPIKLDPCSFRRARPDWRGYGYDKD